MSDSQGKAGLNVGTCTDGGWTVRWNIRYSETAGEQGVGDLYLPDGWTAATPCALLIHGGGWASMDRQAVVGIAEFLVGSLHVAVFNVDYRLASVDHPWPCCGEDCLAAARFVLDGGLEDLSPSALWILGGSSGGHLALWTGLSLPSDAVLGIVSISGIADPEVDYPAHPGMYRGLFGGATVTKELRDSMSVMGLIRPNGPRILLTHASEDAVVPIETARSFECAYRNAGNEIGLFEYSRVIEPGLTGHFIWRAGSNPHRLLARLEREIAYFMTPSAIPSPMPVESDVEITAFYYPGTEQRAEWDMVEQTYPHVKPLLGWYDESDPENLDWQIKWAVEHGISSFCVDWYWNMGVRRLEHWVQAFYRAKFRKHLKWYVMYANHNAAGSHSTADQVALTQFWIDNYFKTPEYYRIDGKPVVVLWQYGRLDDDFIAEAARHGETLSPGDGIRRAFAISDGMAKAAGLPGIYWISMNPGWGQDASKAEFIASMGFQEQMNYNLGGSFPFAVAHDACAPTDTRTHYCFDALCLAARRFWERPESRAGAPVMPLIPAGWDDTPRFFQASRVCYGRSAEKLLALCQACRAFCEAHGIRRVSVAPLNEWQEGTYAEPNEQDGFGMLDAIRDGFCRKPKDGWPTNLTPGDVGRPLLEYPPMALSTKQSWTFEESPDGWYRQPFGCQKTLSKNGCLWFLTTHSSNFQIRQRLVPFAAEHYSEFALRMKVTRNAATVAPEGYAYAMRLKWGTVECPVIEANLSVNHDSCVARCAIQPDGEWHEYRLALTQEDGWRGDVNELWFEAVNEGSCIVEIAWMRFE